MSIQTAIANLQAKALAVTEVTINAAPANPTEAMPPYPFAMSYERRGELQLQSADWAITPVTIVTEVHFAATLLPKVIEQSMKFRDPFLKKIIADITLGGTVEHVITVRWEFGRLGPTEEADIGYRFETDVKVVLST